MPTDSAGEAAGRLPLTGSRFRLRPRERGTGAAGAGDDEDPGGRGSGTDRFRAWPGDEQPAGGCGPFVAPPAFARCEPDRTARPDRAPAAVAERFAPDCRRPATDVIGTAAHAFPGFDRTVMELCR